MGINYFQINLRGFSKAYLTLLLLLACSTITAQTTNFQVSGTVTSSEDNVPLPGVTILLKGTTTGVTTDFDGNYTIAVPNGTGTLIYCYFGF